jgi:hypothetical protein
MLDLATIKFGVDLFKDLVGMIVKGRQAERHRLKANIEPLYAQMEKIASEYHGMMSETLAALSQTNDPDMKAIITRLEQDRANLVMARSGVLGEASALISDLFRDRFAPSSCGRYAILPEGFDARAELVAMRGEGAVLLYDFADAIAEYFDATPYMGENTTLASSVLGAYRQLLHRQQLGEEAREEFIDLLEMRRDTVRRQILELEQRWIDVTKAYKLLRLRYKI